MKYNFKTKELAWTHLIHKEIIEYKRFIGDDNLPDFKIVYSHNTNEKPTYSMKVDTYKRPSNLYVNSGFMIDKNFNYKSTLFHEFTHLWDSENLLKDIPLSEKHKLLFLFTEFHASYVQALLMMGAESINNTQMLESCKITNVINEDVDLIEEYVEKFNLSKSPDNYKGILNAYMYYFGHVVANNISGNNISPKNFNNSFDEGLHLYYSALKFNILDDKVIKLSGNVMTLLDKIFIKTAVTEAGEW